MKDSLCICLDPATRLSFAVADCTSAAAEAARGHLCGPVAAAVLGEALACAALAGAENSAPGEAVAFKAAFPGSPIGGFLAEAAEGGALRAYTDKKVLDAFDGGPFPRNRALYGESGTAGLVRSVPGRILSSGCVAVPTPAKGSVAAAALAALFSESLQRTVAVEAFAFADDGGVPLAARAAILECPPDGDREAFAAASAAFSGGAVAKALKSASSLRNVLGKACIPHAEIRETRPLRFACRCSMERAAGALAAMPAGELARAAAAGKGVDVYCHFCGRLWTVPPGMFPAAANDAKKED